MAYRIEIKYKIPDARAEKSRAYFNNLRLKGKVNKVEVVDVYTLDAKLKRTEIFAIAKLLANPLTQEHCINQPAIVKQFVFAVEIGFLPGVTDNVGNTVRETAEDFLKRKFKSGEAAYFSQVFFIIGKINEADVKIIADSLHNPLIQRAKIKSFSQFKKDKGLGMEIPKVRLKSEVKTDLVNLHISDEELAKLGQEGIKDKNGQYRGPLALDLESLKVIRNYFHKLGRSPTDIELESLAQTWSEHCKHTIFADPLDEIKAGIYKKYIKGATEKIRVQKGEKDFCVSVFSDNSGGIEFDQNFLVTHKVETHNTPSALDPFGGAITGIVGVNRDTLGFGLGAKPVANVYGFCLGDPSDQTELYRDREKQNKMLSAKRILEGVVAGVNAGGNQSGIPTPQGFLCFDSGFRGKPLVFAGTVGLIPKKIGKRLGHIKKAEFGDYIVMLGGRVGLDGIHGATFSSESLNKNSPATAVQIGDPITQKKFSDALVKEARAQNLYNSITDCGAGGLSSAVGEMAKEVGGCEVYLDKVPLKYPGLMPWQIWISESQERMVLSVPKSKWQKLFNLMRRRGAEAAVIGQFANSGKCVVKYKSKIVMDVDLDFLHNGRPIKVQSSKCKVQSEEQIYKIEKINQSQNFTLLIKQLLARPNIASFDFVSSQYDQEVQGSSVIKPTQGRGRVNGEASVIRPVLNSQKGIVLSQSLYPSYSELSAYDMAACSVDSAIRAAICAGADLNFMALLDNFCWCDSNNPFRLHQLKLAAKACYDFATIYSTPFISGKDSMFNDFKGFNEKGEPLAISILPTLLISAISVIPDIKKAVSLDAKFVGDYVYVLGQTKEEMGGSEYYLMQERNDGTSPKVEAKQNLKLYLALQKAIENELVASAISMGRGGLAAALCKTLIAGGLGADVSLASVGTGRDLSLQPEIILFSESQGRIIVTVNPKKAAKFEKIMSGCKFVRVGKITDDKTIKMSGSKGKAIVNLSLTEAEKAYKKTFQNY